MYKSELLKRYSPSASVDTQLQARGIGSSIAQVMPRAKAKCAGTKIGPMRMLQKLDDVLVDQHPKNKWLATARLDALVGASQGSIGSVNSGVKGFWKFALKALGEGEADASPPSVDDLLGWSMLFRQPNTFSNYLGYLKMVCMLVRKSTSVFDDPAGKRAKTVMAKRVIFK